MNKRLLTICFSLVIWAITTSDGNAQPQVLVDCFEERTFKYTGGKYKDAEIKYRLRVPENVRYGQKYPLIVHLHGIGEAGSDNKNSLLYLDSVLPLLTGAKSEDFFLLVVQCPKETPGWRFHPATKDGTLDVLVAAMEHVIEENPIDEKRITAAGVSSGGWGVWELILQHPDKFAGAVPTACGVPSRQLGKIAALQQTPVWVIVNKREREAFSESLQMAKRVLEGSGGSMAWTETNTPGHNAWVPAMTTYNCFQWLLAQERGRWFAPPPGFIVRDKPNSLPFIFMCILPLIIIVVFSIVPVFNWATIAYQSVLEWAS